MPRNDLRALRRKTGLSQHDLALLLGYPGQAQVSKHELGQTTPSLANALAYEVLYRAPASEIFWEIRASVKQSIEEQLSELEKQLLQRSAKGRSASKIAQILTWLEERKEF